MARSNLAAVDATAPGADVVTNGEPVATAPAKPKRAPRKPKAPALPTQAFLLQTAAGFRLYFSSTAVERDVALIRDLTGETLMVHSPNIVGG